MKGLVVVLNTGSSSVKFSVYKPADGDLEPIAKGQIEAIISAPHFLAEDVSGTVLAESEWEAVPADEAHGKAFEALGEWLREYTAGTKLWAVGHRVVLGGPKYDASVLINETVLTDLEALVPLMPLHQPHNLKPIRAIATRRPGLPQIACFDTAFHRGHPSVADRFGLPYELYQEGVRRYGFHGLSYEYIAKQLKEVAPEVAEGRVVIAHLGSGASMCAIKGGKSFDTTMGFSALDGLPMGTRCGRLDPGVLLYLMREKRMNLDAIERLLYKESGLLGISGISNDLRDLLASSEPRAAEAIDYFVYRIGQELGALAAALGGLDALVFTAGIGERSAEIRRRVCRDAAWLGVELDDEANETGRERISHPGTRPSAWVIPTDEERMIALHTLRLVALADTTTVQQI
ncbi:MAG: acetate/propionate family kinase [Gammaproteobacteria bacterium]